MEIHYRETARRALERAKAELAYDDPDRLAYVALEIRRAMEAVTYDRAQAYKNEIPKAQYRTWQPRKVVEYLTEIDPKAVLGSSVAFGVQEERGKPAKVMQHLGTEVVLTMRGLKKNYDKIGSYLHIPTLAQMEQGSVQEDHKIREHCQNCIEILDKVLKSPIWNINTRTISSVECFRCGFLMEKRIKPNAAGSVEARCIECGAGYLVNNDGENKIEWTSKDQQIECPTPGCEVNLVMWEDQIRPGAWWKCDGCNERFMLTLGIAKYEASELECMSEPDRTD